MRRQLPLALAFLAGCGWAQDPFRPPPAAPQAPPPAAKTAASSAARSRGGCRLMGVILAGGDGLALCRLGSEYHRLRLGMRWPGSDEVLSYIGADGSLRLRSPEGAERRLRPG